MKLLRATLASLVLLVGACTACSSGQLPASQPTVNDAITRALHSSVTLYNVTSGSMVCARTRISSTEILTAYHCAVAGALPLKELVLLDDEGIDLNEVPISKVIEKEIRFSTYAEVMAATAGCSTSACSYQVTHKSVVLAADPKHDLALLRTGFSSQAVVSLNARPSRLVRTSSPSGTLRAWNTPSVAAGSLPRAVATKASVKAAGRRWT